MCTRYGMLLYRPTVKRERREAYREVYPQTGRKEAYREVYPG